MAGQTVSLFIRPNNVRFLDRQTEQRENVFDATVQKMTYLGEIIDYRVVMTNGVELRVQTDGQQQIKPGTPIKVYLPPEHCHVIAEGV